MNPAMRYTILVVPWIIRLIAVFFIALGIFKLFTEPFLGVVYIILGLVLYLYTYSQIGGGTGLGAPWIVIIGAVGLFFYGLYKCFTYEYFFGAFCIAFGIVLYQISRDQTKSSGHGGH